MNYEKNIDELKDQALGLGQKMSDDKGTPTDQGFVFCSLVGDKYTSVSGGSLELIGRALAETIGSVCSSEQLTTEEKAYFIANLSLCLKQSLEKGDTR